MLLNIDDLLKAFVLLWAAIFPIAIPSIAGSGAVLAMLLFANRSHESIQILGVTILLMFIVLLVNFLFMRISGYIHIKIGNSGAIIIGKVMGLILASIAANNVLLGIKEYLKIL
jgi:multiple antibiotic resistance protein